MSASLQNGGGPAPALAGPSLTRRSFLKRVAVMTSASSLLSAATEPRWQIGCYTRPWPEADFRVALDGISAAGFAFAGIMTTKSGVVISPQTTPEQVGVIAAEAKSRGLRIASIYGGEFMVKRTIADGIANLRRLIDHASLCGCPNLLLGGTSRAELVDDYYKVVRECCDYAAGHGVGLTVKPHGGLNSTGPQCRQLIEQVAHPGFRLWYDPGNIFYYSDGNLNPVDDAGTVDGLVVGMSVKDFLPPKNVNVTPGTGRVDFPAVLTRLLRGGFHRGPLILECVAGADTQAVTAEAIKARKFIEALVRRVHASA